MDIKEIYAKLETVENGAEMIAAIKAEFATLNNEAKKHRQSSDTITAKNKAILEALGLEDSDDVAEKAKELKSTLDSFAQDGKTPSDVAKQIAKLTKDIATINGKYAEMEKTAQAEKAKRFDAMKNNALIDQLTKGNAAAPKDMAKLIADKLVVNDDETISFVDGENTMSVEDGVKGWLSSNTWAVKANPQGGGGAPAGGGGTGDAFLDGLMG
jgi:hypothetical protein